MGKPRVFATAAISAMRDTELTGQEWRVYLWVSLHDGMSLLKGNGAGCYASNKTLFEEAGCDYSSGCRALSKLVKRGHLVREQLGRSTRYRVTFGGTDNLQACNISSPPTCDEPASYSPPIACNGKSQATEIHGGSEGDYSLRSSKLDLGKPKEINSFETARFSQTRNDPDLPIGDVGEIFQSVFGKRDGAEAPAARGLSIAAWLNQHSKHFAKLDTPAQLCRFEEAFKALGADADKLESRDRSAWTEWLVAISDEFAGDQIGHHAQRLYEELIPF